MKGLKVITTIFGGALLAGCSPRVATSFWKIGTEADSVRTGYAVLHEGKKVRHCYPITEWTDTLPNYVGKNDTYHSLHHHGVAVESELMAYRIYFDKKQTIDPYCKRRPQLELAQSYWYPNDSLLALGYGDDILRVSGTVGVGSVKYWNGRKHCHIEPVAERSERIVRQTRNSATIEVAVKGWEIPTAKRSYSTEDCQWSSESRAVLQSEGRSYSDSGQCVDLIVQYTMQAGHRDMRCDVALSEPVEDLCTGVQTIPAKGNLTAQRSYSETVLQQSGLTGEADRCSFVEQLPNGILLASWGTDWPVNDSAKYAKETVGLAVFIPKAYAGEMVHDKSNNLCLLNLTGTESAGLTAKRSYSNSDPTAKRSEMCKAHFYITCCGATKEDKPVATNAEEWLAYLRQWAKRLH